MCGCNKKGKRVTTERAEIVRDAVREDSEHIGMSDFDELVDDNGNWFDDACPDCDGDGGWYDYDDDDDDMAWSECERCNGTGQL